MTATEATVPLPFTVTSSLGHRVWHADSPEDAAAQHRDAFASGTTCGPLPHPKPAPTGGDRSPTFTPSSTAMVPASPSAPPRAPRPTWTCTSSATTPSWSVTHDKDTPAMTTTPYTPSTDDIVRAYAATRPGDPAEARAELNRWLTTQTVPVTDDLQERLWDAVTDVRDAHPRTKNDADSWDIVAALLGVITGTIPASETDRTKES